MKPVWSLCIVSSVLAASFAGCSTPGPHMSEEVEHGAMCSAIQSASEIEFSKDRSAALKLIAADPELTEHEQEFLVDATLENQGYSGDNTDVLVSLATNPSLTPKARDHLVKRLRRASLYSNDKARLTKALTTGVDPGEQ